MAAIDYSAAYRGINFRKEPQKYIVGRGEQGVLIAEPYKSEILPHWKFATPADAQASATKIFALFNEYKSISDFVGMDMARKYLQMGFTRARRYANHPSGTKYDSTGEQLAQSRDWNDSPKAESARIFYTYYAKAKDDPVYLEMKAIHMQSQKITKP